MANKFEGEVRERIYNGDGQPSYSTKPGWYNPSVPRGAKGRFVAYMRRNGNSTGVVRQSGIFVGNDPRRNSAGLSVRRARMAKRVFLPQGYAQFRAIFKGIGIRTKPVRFHLTGDMLKNLVPKIRVRKTGAEVGLGFKRSKRSYGRLTNEQLREILDKRGAHPAFAVNEPFAEQITTKALQEWLDSAMRGDKG